MRVSIQHPRRFPAPQGHQGPVIDPLHGQPRGEGVPKVMEPEGGQLRLAYGFIKRPAKVTGIMRKNSVARFALQAVQYFLNG
jgi:hypothetical protein